MSKEDENTSPLSLPSSNDPMPVPGPGKKWVPPVKASDEESSDDLDDFLDLLGSSPEPSKSLRGIFNRKSSDESEMNSESDGKEGKTMVGGPVQYSLFGTGFVPSTKTIKTLPAGAYHIRFSQAVGIYFDTAHVITDELIEFPDTQSDKIIAEIDLFWTLKQKFNDFKLLHKRGYILWGPQGSGKSSTIAFIMKKMKDTGGLVIVADNPQFLSSALASLRAVEPNRPIVVVWEDLDSIVRQYGESEVLAVLDGESQVDNICFIATTNFPEMLNDRITNRPSRFDRIEKIGMPSAEARRIYLEAKAKTTVSPDGIDLVAETEGLSIAHLRELIIGIWCLGAPASEVLKRLQKMRFKPNSEHGNNSVGFGS